MTVKVLFFGATADAVGLRDLELSIEETAKAGSVINQLSKTRPQLANYKLLVAVNEEYADANTVLNEGDEIAIFTAVSGG